MLSKSSRVLGAVAVALIFQVSGAVALAAGDAERGALLTDTCLGCHGVEGYASAYPTYRVPRLGGQPAAFILAALNGYKDGQRSHPTMEAQAASLSEQDLADISAYIGSLGAAEQSGVVGAAPQAAATCAACHGAGGISAGPTFPNLAGQHEDYLVHALTQYKDGVRNNASMSAFATQLSEDDIKALARFFASQSGVYTLER
jgi:cytochrome c553